MDALPSVVSVMSVMKEKTISYMKCHSRGCEKVIWPIACIAALIISIICLSVACGTENWVQLEVRNNVSQHRGNITFGLLRGSHRIQYNGSRIANTINGSYYLFDRLSMTYLARLNITFGLSLVAILLCLVNIGVTLLNSYQSVTTWWRGPSMMYLLSLFTSVCGLTAVGVFLDHYYWDLDAPLIFIRVTELNTQNALTIGNTTLTSFQYLLTTRGYRAVPFLRYSFYIEIAGACLPLLVTLLAWRLALLIPPQKLTLIKEKNLTKTGPLGDSNSLQFFSTAGNPNFGLHELSYNTNNNYAEAVEEESELEVEEEDTEPYSSTPTGTPPRKRSVGFLISPETQREVLY